MDDFWMIFTILHHFAFYVQSSDYNNRIHLHGWRSDDIMHKQMLAGACMHCFAFIEIGSDYKNRIPLSWMVFWRFFSSTGEQNILLTLDCICLYCLMECGIVDTSKASQTNKQTRVSWFWVLVVASWQQLFCFPLWKAFLWGRPPLSLPFLIWYASHERGVVGVCLGTWCSLCSSPLLGGSFVFLIVGPSILFLVLLLFLFFGGALVYIWLAEFHHFLFNV